MTTAGSSLVELLRRVRVLLIDFDGPICSVFDGYPAPAVAEELRRLVEARGCRLPEGAAGRGPLGTLRLIADACPPDTVQAAADALRDAELTAARTAEPTPGAHDLLRAARSGGRRIAIVSNNSAEAVRAYLDRHRMSGYVDHVSARYDGMDPRLLKPSDHLIRRALDASRTSPAAAVLVGDSLDDIDAARTASVAVIGYANKPGKRERFTNAEADAVIEAMADLAKAVRAVAVPQ